MRKMVQVLMFMAALLPTPAFSQDIPDIDMNVLQTLTLDVKPVDIGISFNGRRVFALTDTGSLLVYAPDGRLEGRVRVGEGTDMIKATPREDVILVGNSREKTLKVVTLDLIQEIDTRGLPAKGPADAPFEVVVFSDFECPSCAEMASVLDQLMVEYPEQIRVVFMNYPLRSHRYSWGAAAAALAAGRQGRFWEFHDALFDNYDRLNPQKINEIARDLKLDVARLNQDMSHPEVTAAMNRDASEVARLDISGTPTVFVNGKNLRDHSMKSFQALIGRQKAGPRKEIAP